MTEYVGEKGKIDRAQRVDKLLKDPEFIQAFESTKQAIFEKIEQTPIRDIEGLTNLRLCLKLLGDVRANLENVLNDGKIAEFNIEQEKKRRFALFRGKP
jgi:hypothetical protein